MALGFCTTVANAQQRRAATLEIWASEAPLASVLEQIIDQDSSLDVRIGEGVEGLVSGRLEGTVGEVLEPLLETYGLNVHHDGSTVWFDRRDADVVELVALDPEREPLLAEWATRELDGAAADDRGRIVAEGEELRVSGTRAFVQATLDRIEAARGALGERRADGAETSDVRQPSEVLAVPDVLDGEGTAIATVGTMSDAVGRSVDEAVVTTLPESPASAAGAMGDGAGPPYRSVTDIPGYHTEYR